jgi:NosR/NirI family nitrous oxide reductase transcriptional regulator
MPIPAPPLTKWVVMLFMLTWAPLVQAADLKELDEQILDLFHDADRVAEPSGAPPASALYLREQPVGYAFLTDQVVPIPAYSGKPISTLVGFDIEGRIRGVRIITHQEPILAVGISDRDLNAFTGQYPGLKITDDVRIGGRSRPGIPAIDGISGATITVMVINASIIRSVRAVAESRGLIGATDGGGTQVGQGFAPAEPMPLWRQAWSERSLEIAVLSVGLVLLVLILLFQDWLARHPTLLRRLRTGYLLFTLLFIGGYALAQLSIVNVLTFVQSLLQGFSWEGFLMDPMMFLLWSFVAMTVLLWGRGVYCGWLCPFGALQELLFRLGQHLKLPAWEPPAVLHERLWALKYLILLGLFGVSLHALPEAERLVEVEPFKTAFVLRFTRDWPFVLYALVLLAAGLFVRKLFCRYLCPLGAALTFPSRFRIFDWLRRHRECGHPCQTCAVECEVGAIKHNGAIIASECHHCLDCQVTYWNDQRCPPLVERRKREERRARAKAAVPKG